MSSVIVRSSVALAPLTTLRLGGPARTMTDLDHIEDVAEAVREAARRDEPLFVLGAGSNVVFADGGFAGLVARMRLKGIRVHRQPGQSVILDVAAGEDWDALVDRCVQEGWSGLECLSGIPGLVGATPIQNVGAYGQEIGQFLTRVHAFDRAIGRPVALGPSECAFGYRTSIFRGQDRWIVTGVKLRLEASPDSAAIRYEELARGLGVSIGARAPAARVREAVLSLRASKGMLIDAKDPDSVSAGSFFVNPVLSASEIGSLEARAGMRPPCFDAGDGRFKVAAAWLIERAGFAKGWGRGSVGISTKHALALVNRGGAKTSELMALAREIRAGVMARFGVALEPEPILVGISWEEADLQGDKRRDDP